MRFSRTNKDLTCQNLLDPYVPYLEKRIAQAPIIPHKSGRTFENKDLSKLQSGQTEAGTTKKEDRVQAFSVCEEAAEPAAKEELGYHSKQPGHGPEHSLAQSVEQVRQTAEIA